MESSFRLSHLPCPFSYIHIACTRVKSVINRRPCSHGPEWTVDDWNLRPDDVTFLPWKYSIHGRRHPWVGCATKDTILSLPQPCGSVLTVGNMRTHAKHTKTSKTSPQLRSVLFSSRISKYCNGSYEILLKIYCSCNWRFRSVPALDQHAYGLGMLSFQPYKPTPTHKKGIYG